MPPIKAISKDSAIELGLVLVIITVVVWAVQRSDKLDAVAGSVSELQQDRRHMLEVESKIDKRLQKIEIHMGIDTK